MSSDKPNLPSWYTPPTLPEGLKDLLEPSEPHDPFNRWPNPPSTASKATAAPQAPAPRQTPTSPLFAPERAELDAWVAANASRPLGECKQGILDLLNKCIGKAYEAGGAAMEQGIRDANPQVRWR